MKIYDLLMVTFLQVFVF